MVKAKSVALFRLLFGVLVLAAIITQLRYLSLLGTLNPVNFFSYFTILSNLFAAGVFLYGYYLLSSNNKRHFSFDVVRGAATLCMVIVGVVFSLLLRNQDVGGMLPWVNVVLHYVMPLAVLAEWLWWPPVKRLTFRKVSAYWLLFPALYIIYTLIRGAYINWYPYPFLNPDKAGGHGAVAAYCVAIFGLFLLVSWLLTKVPKRSSSGR